MLVRSYLLHTQFLSRNSYFALCHQYTGSNSVFWALQRETITLKKKLKAIEPRLESYFNCYFGVTSVARAPAQECKTSAATFRQRRILAVSVMHNYAKVSPKLSCCAASHGDSVVAQSIAKFRGASLKQMDCLVHVFLVTVFLLKLYWCTCPSAAWFSTRLRCYPAMFARENVFVEHALPVANTAWSSRKSKHGITVFLQVSLASYCTDGGSLSFGSRAKYWNASGLCRTGREHARLIKSVYVLRLGVLSTPTIYHAMKRANSCQSLLFVFGYFCKPGTCRNTALEFISINRKTKIEINRPLVPRSSFNQPVLKAP